MGGLSHEEREKIIAINRNNFFRGFTIRALESFCKDKSKDFKQLKNDPIEEIRETGLSREAYRQYASARPELKFNLDNEYPSPDDYAKANKYLADGSAEAFKNLMKESTPLIDAYKRFQKERKFSDKELEEWYRCRLIRHFAQKEETEIVKSKAIKLATEAFSGTIGSNDPRDTTATMEIPQAIMTAEKKPTEVFKIVDPPYTNIILKGPERKMHYIPVKKTMEYFYVTHPELKAELDNKETTLKRRKEIFSKAAADLRLSPSWVEKALLNFYVNEEECKIAAKKLRPNPELIAMPRS